MAEEIAQRHIESLRRGIPVDKDIDPNDLSLRDLRNSLTIISQDLYEDSTHFIWELLQNADDASYADDVKPELRLILTDKSLYVWSNQESFDRSNVDSLCAIGESSKRCQEDTIGEKGIGFKSVFDVADVVKIDSKPYRFQLDTTGPLGNLGMIIPTWRNKDLKRIHSKFTIPDHGTTMELRLKKSANIRLLQQDMVKFDFSFLLFSRRLESLSLSDFSGDSNYVREGTYRETKVDKIVKLVINHNNVETARYFRTFDKRVTGMPPEDKRPGQTESDIVLAYPLNKALEPKIQLQKTYAFLPLNTYGFTFLIHADFVLSSNRGGIKQNLPWNVALRNHLVQTIQNSITWFATSDQSKCRFEWPNIIRCLSRINGNFFEPLSEALIESLRETRLIATDLSGDDQKHFYQQPRLALVVGPEFRHNGSLILDSTPIRARVVSQSYSPEAILGLELLGAQRFRHPDFYGQLQSMIRLSWQDFAKKGTTWHSEVARVLLEYIRRWPTALSKCRKLKLVPLSNGKWVSAERSNILLPSSSQKKMPSGLSTEFVDTDACQDSVRCELFRILGIKRCTKKEICRMILEDHENASTLCLDTVVQHTVFLFEADYEPLVDDELWVFNSRGMPRKNRNMLIPFGKHGRNLRKLFRQDFKGVSWLHDSYETAVKPNKLDDWITWLQSWTQCVSLWPRLISQNEISVPMRHIYEHNGSKALLSHLKLRHEMKRNLPKSIQWRNETKNLEVSTNQGLVKLCDTALPALAQDCEDIIPLLDLDDAKKSAWSFLTKFDVLTAVDVSFLLQKLNILKTSDDCEDLKLKVGIIYSKLGLFTKSEEQAQIRAAFKAEELILIPQTPVRWRRPADCRWFSPWVYTRCPLLQQIYPNASDQNLFESILKVVDTNLDDLIDELEYRASTKCKKKDRRQKVKVICECLYSLSEQLKEEELTKSQVSRLRKLTIFPVTTISPGQDDVLPKLVTADSTFWVADIPFLWEIFASGIPLLSTYDCQRWPDKHCRIIDKLGLNSKQLTACVQSVEIHDDTRSFIDKEITRNLKTKIPYIISIMEKSKLSPERLHVLKQQLFGLEVHRVEAITIRRFVLDECECRFGLDQKGEVCIDSLICNFNIFVRKSLADTEIAVPLFEALVKLLGIKNTYRELFLSLIATSRPASLREAFQRAGIVTPEVSIEVADSNGAHSSEAAYENEPIDILKHEFETLCVTSQDTPIKDQIIPQINISDGGKATEHRRDSTSSEQISSPEIEPNADSVRGHTAESSHFRQSRLSSHGRETPGSHTSILTRKDIVDRMTNVSINKITARPYRSLSNDNLHNFASETTLLGSLGGTKDTSSFWLPLPHLDSDSADTLRVTHKRSRSSSDFSFSQSQGNIPSAVRSPHRKSISTHSDEELPYKIGCAGEYLVYKYFNEALSPKFDHRHWTSRYRNKFFEDKFEDREKDFADFTFIDEDGKLGALLTKIVPSFCVPSEVEPVKYHLEVKSTMDGIDKSVYLSNNQIQKAKSYSQWVKRRDESTQPNVYILIRVYDLALKDPPDPKMQIFIDPWDWICRDLLKIEGETGKVLVKPTESDDAKPFERIRTVIPDGLIPGGDLFFEASAN